MPEAVPLEDLDEGAIKSEYATAVSSANSAADGSVEKATAQIQIDTLQSMARAIGVTL